MTPGAYRFLEWGTATSDPRSQVLDHAGAMIFTGSTVRRLAMCEQAPPGLVTTLVTATSVVVSWADGDVGAIDSAELVAVARPDGMATRG